MAKLTMEQRHKLLPKEFAGPNRSFPINDAKHARAAIMLSKFAPDPGAVKRKAEAKLKSLKGK